MDGGQLVDLMEIDKISEIVTTTSPSVMNWREN